MHSPAKGFTAQDLADHVRREFSTFTWLFEPMLERCGFEILESNSRRSAYGMYLCRKTQLRLSGETTVGVVGHGEIAKIHGTLGILPFQITEFADDRADRTTWASIRNIEFEGA